MKNEKKSYLDVIFKMTFELTLPVDLYSIYHEQFEQTIDGLLTEILDCELEINKFMINEKGMLDMYFNVLTDDTTKVEHALMNYQSSDGPDYFTLGEGIVFNDLQIYAEEIPSFDYEEDLEEDIWQPIELMFAKNIKV